jgi:hypothetical protein
MAFGAGSAIGLIQIIQGAHAPYLTKVLIKTNVIALVPDDMLPDIVTISIQNDDGIHGIARIHGAGKFELGHHGYLQTARNAHPE